MRDVTGRFRSLIMRIKKNEGRGGIAKVYFTNDRVMRELNKRYRGIDRTTDVLSFSMEEPGFLGEIVIVPVKNEVRRLVIHGMLHLLGYDHGKRNAAQLMRKKEELYLRSFGAARGAGA